MNYKSKSEQDSDNLGLALHLIFLRWFGREGMSVGSWKSLITVSTESISTKLSIHGPMKLLLYRCFRSSANNMADTFQG